MFYNLIFTYDPEITSHGHKVMCCLVKGDHIYTLDHNINSLAQKPNTVDPEFVVVASPNYEIKRKKDVKHHMIETMDDVKKLY